MYLSSRYYSQDVKYEENGFTTLARVESLGASARVYWYHAELNGLPERMTDAEGETVWQGTFSAWGRTLAESGSGRWRGQQNLRFQGQYLDRETGLHYNTLRYYDAWGGCYTQVGPIGLAGGLNTYGYVGDPLGWVDPLGLASCRIKYMGRTPGKRSCTGKAVIERMRKERRIIGSDDNMRFKSSTDGKWYPVKMADMAHLQDAVSYWNQRGGFFGAKASEVRSWMKDPNNYELEYFSHNRSQGAKLLENYKDSTDFIGPAEMPQCYFRSE